MNIFDTISALSQYRKIQIVWCTLGFIEVLLVFRFILKFLGSTPVDWFASFIYGASYIFATPFLFIFHITPIATSDVEWTTFLASFIYWVVALCCIRLFFTEKTTLAAVLVAE